MLIIDTYRDLMEQERLTEQEKVVIEQWKPVLDELDRMENCNNRRHKEKRDMLDMTLCECQNEKEEYLSSEIKLKLSDTDENWLEWTFSRSSADLYQLTGNIELAKSLQTLTAMQRKVVFFVLYPWVFRKGYCHIVGQQRAEYPKTAGKSKGTYENIVLERRQKP